MSTQRFVRLALYTALAMGIYGIESAIPAIFPIPGMKLGLANIITLIVLKQEGGHSAAMVLLCRIFLSCFLFGSFVSFFYSLAGGMLCLLAMQLFCIFLTKNALYLTGIIGAIFHNIGQILIAMLLTRTSYVLSYLPFLMISAILTGLFTGLCAHLTDKYLFVHLKSAQ